MKETRRLIIGKKKQTLTGRAVVGPETDSLKERFKEGSIPLQTDFEKLIDIADVGRKAVGLAPWQEGKPGVGLQLGSGERLSVKLNTNSGLTVTDAGVSVALKTNGGVLVDANGISVKPGRGMEVTSDGIRIKDEFAFRPGMILMFSGTTMPTGWALCDGTVGRPDLRDRFILGATTLTDNNQTNGSKVNANKQFLVNSNSIAPSVTVNVNGRALTIAQIPSHTHQIKSAGKEGTGGQALYERNGLTPSFKTTFTQAVGSGLAHDHTATGSQVSHNHTTNVVPPYYILAFIIKL
ncbi:hypothetical protein Z042_02580 [Chania multitudinisentens RB-25]|uniref:Uncharacterized protein n=1 Tax=Chania multitudinisentens RB-25 TaxID=1441930 RepID=W0LJV6_9GAMM|nr:tail fiber protein [Chania multitudinisentens]AHG22617.1 hypothetical protein Z042_02580 [Chania multitudinisentens RB-25]